MRVHLRGSYPWFEAGKVGCTVLYSVIFGVFVVRLHSSAGVAGLVLVWSLAVRRSRRVVSLGRHPGDALRWAPGVAEIRCYTRSAPSSASYSAPGSAATRRCGAGTTRGFTHWLAAVLRYSTRLAGPLSFYCTRLALCYALLAGPCSSRRSSVFSVVRRSAGSQVALSVVASVSRWIPRPHSVVALCGSVRLSHRRCSRSGCSSVLGAT